MILNRILTRFSLFHIIGYIKESMILFIHMQSHA